MNYSRYLEKHIFCKIILFVYFSLRFKEVNLIKVLATNPRKLPNTLNEKIWNKMFTFEGRK